MQYIIFLWLIYYWRFVLLNPLYLFIISHPLPTTLLFSLPMSSFLFCFFCFLDFTYERLYSICLPFCDLFHLAKYIPDPSMLLWMVRFNFFMDENIPVFVYVCIFIYSPINRHLGCFHILAIVNNATVNVCGHISYWISIFIFFGLNTQKWNFWIIWQFNFQYFEFSYCFPRWLHQFVIAVVV